MTTQTLQLFLLTLTHTHAHFSTFFSTRQEREEEGACAVGTEVDDWPDHGRMSASWRGKGKHSTHQTSTTPRSSELSLTAGPTTTPIAAGAGVCRLTAVQQPCSSTSSSTETPMDTTYRLSHNNGSSQVAIVCYSARGKKY